MYIVLNIIMWLAGIAGFIGIIGIIPLVIIGAVLLSKQSKEVDPTRKNSLHKKGIFFLVLPWVLIGGGLLLLVIVKVLSSLLK